MPTIPDRTADATDFFLDPTLYKKIRFIVSCLDLTAPGKNQRHGYQLRQIVFSSGRDKKISFPIITSQ
jgi:hypothetical protein